MKIHIFKKHQSFILFKSKKKIKKRSNDSENGALLSHIGRRCPRTPAIESIVVNQILEYFISAYNLLILIRLQHLSAVQHTASSVLIRKTRPTLITIINILINKKSYHCLNLSD